MDIVTYIDSIGRTCFGQLVEKTDTTLKVKAPAMIMVTPNDAANIKVDVMPLFFTEFSEGELPVFVYQTSQYIEVEVKISDKILQNYNAKINTKEEKNPEPAAEPEITLFEDGADSQ